MFQRFGLMVIGALCCLSAITNTNATEPEDTFRERINKGTVGVISGGVNGTYIRIASDLANVLDDGDSLRVLAIIGKGSVQNIDDILYLRGIDIGIVQSDVLTFVKREGTHPTIGQRIRYITKLYNEELHLLGSSEVLSVADLAGKKVNFDVRGSGTYMTASILFDTLGVEVEPVTFDQALALEKLKSGEIAAMVYVAGKPVTLFKNLSGQEGLHFLPIEYTPSVLETYLPSRFTHQDYSQLIPEDEEVQTLAVGAVMAVYNWPSGTVRHRKVSHFIDAFFSHFADFQQPPRHPKWQEVSLTASLPGWVRFEPAEEWLKNNLTGDSLKASPDLRKAFTDFLQEAGAMPTDRQLTDSEKDELFQQFIRWFNRQEQ